MRDLRNAQAILQRNIDLDRELVVERVDAYTLVALLGWQQYRLAIAQVRRGQPQHPIAATDRLDRNAVVVNRPVGG